MSKSARKTVSASASSRPELSKRTTRRSNSSGSTLNHVWQWARVRTTPLVHVAVGFVVLAVCMFISLMLRTQMIENSFSAAQTTSNISELTQDVQEDQAKLDALEATLPDKAQQMGMVPQEGTVSIDLQGYKSQERQ